MEDWIVWIIIIALAIIIGNQTRERQARETEGLTKKQKEKYFENIKKKQKEDTSKVLWWTIGGLIIFAVLFLGFIFLISGQLGSWLFWAVVVLIGFFVLKIMMQEDSNESKKEETHGKEK